jgi:hypothetical protein
MIRVFLDGRDVTSYGVFLANTQIGYVRLGAFGEEQVVVLVPFLPLSWRNGRNGVWRYDERDAHSGW